MFVIIKKISFAILFTAILALITLEISQAGSGLDFGQLAGTPLQANYLAWMGNAGTPPSQVLTEDGYNSPSGTNQGYQNQYWLLNASNFSNPAATNGQTIYFIFGGLGSDTGKIWTYSFVYDSNVPETDHGQGNGTQASGTCPLMTQGSWDGSQKVINWSGPAGRYLIYRSTLPSGATNNASNGRYDYVSYVDTTGNSGTYTDNITINSWHIVIPANPSTNAIIGCHSVESSPTVVKLSNFHASVTSNPRYWFIIVGLGVIGIATLGLLITYRRRGLH